MTSHMNSNSASPTLCYPLVPRTDEHREGSVIEEEVVDPTLAMMRNPILGTDTITGERGKGDGALPARPLPSPKEMTDQQRKIHDITSTR